MKQAITIARHSGNRAAVWLLAFLMVGWSMIGPHANAQTAASKEYQVKAAYLLNFVQYIEWPATAFSGADAPITIGVLGDDPFGSALEQTFQDESVQGRKFAIKRSRQIEDLKACQLLFISLSEKSKLSDVLTSLDDACIVTVGDTDDFARRGGIINFYMEGNKIRFEINAAAAQHKGLKIGAQLLKRAKIVGSDPGKGGA